MAASCLTPKILCLISRHSVEIPDQVGNDRLVRKDGKFRATLTWTFYSSLKLSDFVGYLNTTDRVSCNTIANRSITENGIFIKRNTV